MTARVLLGVDVGTTSAKGAAFDLDGRVLAQETSGYEHRVPAAGWAEADADSWWAAVCRILVSLTATVGGQVEAVGITGQAPTLLAVDADGRPLAPAILWLDVRADAEASALAASMGPRAEAIAGNRLHAFYLGPKALWLRSHAPDVWARTATFLQSHSYPVLRLTGARVTDPSSAALCVPLYDAQARAWSAEGAVAAGVEIARLPALRPARDVAGAVTGPAARETGLAPGTPVVVGGADFAASTLAAGVTEPGEACLMLGTSGNLIVPMARPDFDTRLINAHHVGCDRYLALGATLAGAAQEWFRSVFARGVSFDALDAECGEVPVGAEGLRLLPYLQGERTPLWDASARGAFVGLSLAHGRGHLYRAVLEGVALSLRHSFEVLRERGTTLDEVVAVNGGARSAVWRQILCDALGAPLAYLPDGLGAPAGAALLAGLGVGAVSAVSAAKAWRGRLVRHVPDPARHEMYTAMLAERLTLYPALRRVA